MKQAVKHGFSCGRHRRWQIGCGLMAALIMAGIVYDRDLLASRWMVD